MMNVKLDRDELAPKVSQFVRSVIEKSGLELTIRVDVNGECIRVDITGEDEEYLFADGARLLYALNHLVNQAFFRWVKGECSFLVDSSNYRTDRTVELELMAEKAAERVRASGVKVVLQPMPSTERRVIHLALADAPGVRTLSEGSGRFRRVLIVPE
jgi:spoIIIJ-associated protein